MSNAACSPEVSSRPSIQRAPVVSLSFGAPLGGGRVRFRGDQLPLPPLVTRRQDQKRFQEDTRQTARLPRRSIEATVRPEPSPRRRRGPAQTESRAGNVLGAAPGDASR